MSNDQRPSVSQSVVETAFDQLSGEHKQLLLWYRVHKLSYEEIADRLGIPLSELIRKMGGLIYTWCCAVERAESAERH